MMMQMGYPPEMYFSNEPSVFLEQALVVFILTMAVGLYPVVNIGRLRVIGALRG